MKLLLVEDDIKIAEFVKKGLKYQQHQVDLAYDGLLGEKLAMENEYDVAIFDVILPGLNGLDLCKRIRAFKPELPILLLTALGTTKDKISGFDAGADDYLVKPFHFEELLARVHSLAKRKQRAVPNMVYRVADLELDMYKRVVRRGGKEIQLTAKEFSLLEFLIINKNRVLSRSYIAEAVWGINFDRGTNIIDVYINYLRTKIDKDFSPPLIHTIIGMGYVLKED